MTRQRLSFTVIVTAATFVFAGELLADTIVVGSPVVAGVVASHRAGVGIWIGGPVAPPICHPPVHREVVVAAPWRHRFVPPWPPRHEPIVVHHPPVRHVVIERAPVVTIPAPAVPVPLEEGTVTVWITNSNGSRTSVKLTKHGPWYVGPRGEWYTTMPTNEQLRVVYGF